jgi:pimeloyl-ACP methyl ester carboxylesterase/ketosteroid isomerase-like protein
MSEENVEVIRDSLIAYAERGLDALAKFWDADIRWRAIEGAPDDVGELRGPEAVRRYLQEWLDVFENVTNVPEELVDLGDDRVLAVQRSTGRAKGSGVATEIRYAVVYTLRDGKIVCGREYIDRARALEALELSPAVAAPEPITIEARGMSFAALAWGDPSAPLALMIHGYPDTAWTWRHLGPYLAERGWRAVAAFTRGYAPTELAADDSYLIADQAADIVALHKELGGDGRAVLIGHDWGAAALWEVTARAPSRFARYVAMAVPPPLAMVKPFASLRTVPLGARQSRMSWYFLYNLLPGSERGLDRVIPKLWRDWSPGYDAADDLAYVFESLRGRGRRRAALRYYRNNFEGGLKATFRIKPGAPALYLHGEQDGCMDATLIELAPDAFAPGSRSDTLPGVGHFLQLEDPERVNCLISDWLGTPAPRT